LKKAAFLLTPLLGVLLFLTAVPSKLGTHLSTRFLQDAVQETGLSPTLAVVGDYRSFDLLLLMLVAWGCGSLGLLGALTNLPHTPLRGRSLAAMLLLSFGILVGVGIGLFTLWGGGNLLDFEPFAQFVPSAEARGWGALSLGFSCSLCAVGVLFSCRKGAGPSHGD